MVDAPSDVGLLVLWKGEMSSVREVAVHVEGVEDRGGEGMENVNWSLEGSVYEWNSRRERGRKDYHHPYLVNRVARKRMMTPSRCVGCCPWLDPPRSLRKSVGRNHEAVEDARGMYHEGLTDHC